MSTTNEVWINGQRLDLDEETNLLPTFQANDRSKPDSIQSDYSPEFSAPGTARNHRLLGHAAAASTAGGGAAYQRLPAVLTSGGVETLPIALLYVKSFSEGRYQLQLVGGNRRLVEALGEKRLADLDLSRFNHAWTPANIAARLPLDYWQTNGYGYEIYERGRPLDFAAIDPYTLFPSVAARLVWQQILADAGFTADTLDEEPLFAALNIPAATAYTFSDKLRKERTLLAGWRYRDGQAFVRTAEFAPILFDFNYTARPPFTVGSALSFTGGRATVPTQGYYRLRAALRVSFGCRPFPDPGEVSMKVAIHVNGALVVDAVERVGSPTLMTLIAEAGKVLLQAGDVVDVRISGDEWESDLGTGPVNPYWYVGYVRPIVGNAPPYDPTQFRIEPDNRFEIELLAEFPQGGTVKLQDWLPDMKQLDYVKAIMLLLGLTIQVDAYRPHLRLAPGYRLLDNVPAALDWTAKRDAAHAPGRLPERAVSFRFGDYAQVNTLAWEPDELVREGYGDGVLAVADAALPMRSELGTLPFAATEVSPDVAGLLRIENERRNNFTAPATYDTLAPLPRLVLRGPGTELAGQLVLEPERTIARPFPLTPMVIPAVLGPFTTTFSYFEGLELSLVLSETVLTRYWADLRAMLDETRYLTERYRLTAADIVALDFSLPIYDAALGDYFALSRVGEFDARRPTEVVLVRLNGAALPAPATPGEGLEFAASDFETTNEFY